MGCWSHIKPPTATYVTISTCKLKIYDVYIRSYQIFLDINILFSWNFGRVSFVFFRYQVIDSIISQPVTSITIFVPSLRLPKLKHISISQIYFI